MSDPSEPRSPGDPPAPPPSGAPAPVPEPSDDRTPEPAPALTPDLSPTSVPATTEVAATPVPSDLEPAPVAEEVGDAPAEVVSFGASEPASPLGDDEPLAAPGAGAAGGVDALDTTDSPLGDGEPLAAAGAGTAGGADELDTMDEEEFEAAVAAQYEPSRWAGVLTTLGAGLVAVVAVQVVGALVEGLTLREGERISTAQLQVADDLLHRLGYPFFNLVTPSLIVLLVAIALLALPWITGHRRTPGQDTIASVALKIAMVMGIVLALGSMLAVRASLHEYAVKNISVPRYLRINYTTFLLVTLGTAALTVFGAVASMLHGDRRR